MKYLLCVRAWVRKYVRVSCSFLLSGGLWVLMLKYQVLLVQFLVPSIFLLLLQMLVNS